MQERRFMHSLVAVLALVSLLLQGTWVLAGTTGTLSGTITDQKTGSGFAQAKITATSPSQTVSTMTDAGGHFTFASLAPDTYTVSAEKQGYDPLSQSGINIFADQVQTVTFSIHPPIKEIARVLSRAATDLVKPGTTADIYSVNSLQQEKFAGIGGGGGLNNRLLGDCDRPGAYVPNNQSGYFQTVHIRDGDYDQVGYEIDGAPVNRSFDNYAAGTASSLGQQELQVYTGAAPANAEGRAFRGSSIRSSARIPIPASPTSISASGPVVLPQGQLRIWRRFPEPEFFALPWTRRIQSRFPLRRSRQRSGAASVRSSAPTGSRSSSCTSSSVISSPTLWPLSTAPAPRL